MSGVKHQPIEVRLAEQSEFDSNGCLVWTGHCNSYGYAVITYQCKKWVVSRLVMHLAGHDIDSKVVRHTCDNPPCINEDHLIVGTHGDNHADMVAKGRHKHGWKHGTRSGYSFHGCRCDECCDVGRPYVRDNMRRSRANRNHK